MGFLNRPKCSPGVCGPCETYIGPDAGGSLGKIWQEVQLVASDAALSCDQEGFGNGFHMSVDHQVGALIKADRSHEKAPTQACPRLLGQVCHSTLMLTAYRRGKLSLTIDVTLSDRPTRS